MRDRKWVYLDVGGGENWEEERRETVIKICYTRIKSIFNKIKNTNLVSINI